MKIYELIALFFILITIMSNQIMVIERVGDVDLLQQALANAGEDLILNQTQVMDQTELLNILQVSPKTQLLKIT